MIHPLMCWRGKDERKVKEKFREVGRDVFLSAYLWMYYLTKNCIFWLCMIEKDVLWMVEVTMNMKVFIIDIIAEKVSHKYWRIFCHHCHKNICNLMISVFFAVPLHTVFSVIFCLDHLSILKNSKNFYENISNTYG